MKKFIKVALLFSLILTFSGVFLYKKFYILDKDKLGSILSYFYTLKSTEDPDLFKEKSTLILKAHGVSPNRFKRSLNYYSQHLDKLQYIYKKALDEILLQNAIIRQN